MPYVERNQDGVVVGIYANAQPGYAEEWLEEDHADVVAFRNPPVSRRIELNKRQFYTALALLPHPVTEQPFITFEEAYAAMAGNALPAALEAIVENTPGLTDAQRFVMRGKLLHGVRYLSDDEMVPGIAASQNLTDEQVYGFFQFALTI